MATTTFLPWPLTTREGQVDVVPRLQYLPDLYWPTFPEWLLFFGTIGLFAGLLLLFARYLPVVSMYEARHDERQETTS